MKKLLLVISIFVCFNSFGQTPMYKLLAKKASSCANLLLDDYSGASAAYSLRKLDCQYAGSAIRVRESGSNTETDIGFTVNGDLDTSAISGFCEGNSGYVVTWYDQSGNGSNITQSTAGNQPRIYNAGVIERQGAMPAVRFLSSSSTYLDGGDILDLSELYFNAFSTIAWGSAANQSAFGKSAYADAASRWSYIKDAGTLFQILRDNSNTNLDINISYSNTDYSLFQTYINKSTDSSQLKKNDTQLVAGTGAMSDAAYNTGYSFFMGAYQNSAGTSPQAGYYLDGYIGEAIFYRVYWTSTQRVAITTNINSYYTVY